MFRFHSNVGCRSSTTYSRKRSGKIKVQELSLICNFRAIMYVRELAIELSKSEEDA